MDKEQIRTAVQQINKSSILKFNEKSQEGRVEHPDCFHCSSGGSCIRKVIIDHLMKNMKNLNEEDVNGAKAISREDNPHETWNNLKTLFLHDRKYNLALKGIFRLGHMFHRLYNMVYEENILVGEELSPKKMVDDYLKVKMSVPNTPYYIIGTGDAIADFGGGAILWIDFKTSSKGKMAVLDKEDEVPVDKILTNVIQLVGYHLGRSEETKQLMMRDDKEPGYMLIFIGKNDLQVKSRIFTAKEIMECKPMFVDYWKRVFTAYNKFRAGEGLPPAVPEESWMCRWGRKKDSVFCKYYEVCFPKKAKKDHCMGNLPELKTESLKEEFYGESDTHKKSEYSSKKRSKKRS